MNQLFDPPIPARIHAEAEKWDLLEGKHPPHIVPLSVADMELRSPPAIVSALEETARSGLWGYTGWGNRYFQALQGWMSSRHGWSIQREWILRTNGVVQGIFAAVRALTSPGDGIVIQTPVYPPFFQAVQDNGRILLENPLRLVHGRYEMDFDDLEEKLSRPTTTAMILCSPHNPVGRVWTEEELRRLGDLCLAHHVLVISDEIHSDLIQPGHRHTVFATLGETYADNCIIGSACSKTFSLAGLCCANLLVPDPVKREKLAQEIHRSGCYTYSIFGVRALEVGYEQCGPWLDELLVYLQGNYQYLVQFMAQHFPQVWIAPLEGTYLAWMDLRGLGMSCEQLREFLEQEALLFLSHGASYGAEGFERINLACSRSVLEHALERLRIAAAAHGLVASDHPF